MSCFKLSMPISTCRIAKSVVTLASLESVFTPHGVIGTSLTSNNAPAGNLFLNAAENKVAVSISTNTTIGGVYRTGPVVTFVITNGGADGFL